MAFSGWPWATLGYAQHLNPGLLGIAQWTGVYGLSFAVALGGAALADLWLAWRRRARPALASGLALAAVALLHAAGLATSRPLAEDARGPTLRVAAIQGNIDQGMKWSPAWSDQTLSHYEQLTRRAAELGAEVIVWPETAVPGALEADAMLLARVRALARETGAVLVVGSVGVEASSRGDFVRFFDSAFVIDRDAGLVERYDKSHLVPFGEYVPFRSVLGGLFGAVASGIATADVTPGAGPRAVVLRLGEAAGTAGAKRRAPPLGESVRVGVPICYELLFPDLVRRFVSDGATMLLAITNDAWYGRTGAPYHFLAITALRSAETGVFTVRVANTGVSAVIDARGRVRDWIPIFERDLLVADVPVRAASTPGTFYVRNGDVFAQACCLVLVGLAVRAGIRQSARGQGQAKREARDV
jgi:apolipoprotein N-acyltransferase